MIKLISYCICCNHPFPVGEGYLGDICDNCDWEVDTIEDDPIGYSAANHMTLNAYRKMYLAARKRSERKA